MATLTVYHIDVNLLSELTAIGYTVRIEHDDVGKCRFCSGDGITGKEI